MIDPLSVSAVAGFLGTVGTSLASESGRRLSEAAGAMVSRVAGREVEAPVGSAERETVARILVEAAGRDPERARALGALMSGSPVGSISVDGAPPRLLRPAVRHFVDRKEALALLRREATRSADGRPRVAVVYGPEGVGSSETAARFGGQESQLYPDGTLYADLRGSSESAAPTPSMVLRRFLVQLHVPEERIPVTTQDRSDLFRTLLDGRRLLVVLDHAQSAAQVLPLLTAASGVFTIVVTRRPLTGLDAVVVPVGPLSDKDSRRLLTALAGKQAMAAARAALPSVLERCAGNPLALRTVVPDLGAAAFGVGGAAGPVQSAVALQYGLLSPESARLYRLCSLRAWPALSPGPAAAAAGIGEGEAARLLAELEGRNLVQAVDGRYRYRPVVREHALEAAARTDGLAECAAAVGRTVDWFVRFAVLADNAALRERPHTDPLFEELGPGPYEDEGAAVAALVAEINNVVESVLAAEEFGQFATACRGTEALWAVQLKAGLHETVLPALRAGTRAADRHCPGSEMAGRMHTQLAFALMEMPSRYDEAARELDAGADAYSRSGQFLGQATAVESLGLLRLRQWRFAAALECFEAAGRSLDEIAPPHPDARHLPRARALLERHSGRALRGLGRFEQARDRLGAALAFFRAPASAEPYNEARVLTDLAETEREAGDNAAALRLIDQAVPLLHAQHATVHVDYLSALRGQILDNQM